MADAQVDSWFDELFREAGGDKDGSSIELTHRVERHLRRFDEEDRARLRDSLLAVVRSPTHARWTSALTVMERLWGDRVAPDLHAAYESLPRRARWQREEMLDALCRLGYSPVAPLAVTSVRARIRRGALGVMAAIAWLVRVDREASITLMATHLRREYKSINREGAKSKLLPGPMVVNYADVDPGATDEVLERLSGPAREFWSERVAEFRRLQPLASVTHPG